MTGQAAAQPSELQLAAADATDDGLLYVLFVQHYTRLVRFATTVSGSTQHGEDAVQDAFARLFARPRRLRDRAAAEAYLRSAVLNAARSHHRRRSREQLADRATERAHALDATGQLDARHDIVAAMRDLPRREREAVALRYLLDLSEQETARELRVSVGSVKGYTSRGLDRLALLLGNRDD